MRKLKDVVAVALPRLVSDEDGVDQDEEDEEAEAIDLVTLPYHFLSSLLTVGQRKQVFVPDNNLHTSLKLGKANRQSEENTLSWMVSN